MDHGAHFAIAQHQFDFRAGRTEVFDDDALYQTLVVPIQRAELAGLAL